jgi:hypothetical protein
VTSCVLKAKAKEVRACKHLTLRLPQGFLAQGVAGTMVLNKARAAAKGVSQTIATFAI